MKTHNTWAMNTNKGPRRAYLEICLQFLGGEEMSLICWGLDRVHSLFSPGISGLTRSQNTALR